MFEQKRPCGDGAHPTWTEELRNSDPQVDSDTVASRIRHTKGAAFWL